MNLYSSQVRFTSSNIANAFNLHDAFCVRNIACLLKIIFVLWIRFAHKTNPNARGFNSFCAPPKGERTKRIESGPARSKTKRVTKRIQNESQNEFPPPDRPAPVRTRLPRVASVETSWPTTPIREIDASCRQRTRLPKMSAVLAYVHKKNGSSLAIMSHACEGNGRKPAFCLLRVANIEISA